MTQTQFSWWLLLYLLFLIYPELFPIWKCWRTTYITLVIESCHPEVKAYTPYRLYGLLPTRVARVLELGLWKL